ncbi:MAG: glycosyltransferase [Chloroflexi bacterium]|nr:glycosyltransferase [Chloroflexota bacterium]
MTGRAGPAVIAINATILGERPTGLGVYALGLIRALAARGEDLRVIASQAADLGGSCAIVGAPAATRPERGPLGHLARLIWLQARLPRRISGTGTSVLLNLVPEGPLRCPIPQVTVVHDLIPLFYPAEPPRIPRAHLYFRYVVPILLRASRAVVTVSEATRRDVLARYRLTPERVHVAHPGYDPARFAPGPASWRRSPGSPRGRARRSSSVDPAAPGTWRPSVVRSKRWRSAIGWTGGRTSAPRTSPGSTAALGRSCFLRSPRDSASPRSRPWPAARR